jgi:hypothetical protein
MKSSVSSRVNRHGSIMISRRILDDDDDDDDVWKTRTSTSNNNINYDNRSFDLRNNTTFAPAELSTIDDLRESGAQFEQRQQELDVELERLTKQLADATPPKTFSSISNNNNSFNSGNNKNNQHIFSYSTTASPTTYYNQREGGSQQLARHTSTGRRLQQSSQRHYNWRSPGPFEGKDHRNLILYETGAPSNLGTTLEELPVAPVVQTPIPESALPPPSATMEKNTPNAKNYFSARISRSGSITIQKPEMTASPSLKHRSPGLRPISLRECDTSIVPTLNLDNEVKVRKGGIEGGGEEGDTNSNDGVGRSFFSFSSPPQHSHEQQQQQQQSSTSARVSRHGSIIIQKMPTHQQASEPSSVPNTTSFNRDDEISELKLTISKLNFNINQLKEENGT